MILSFQLYVCNENPLKITESQESGISCKEAEVPVVCIKNHFLMKKHFLVIFYCQRQEFFIDIG